ncbi:N-terminal nucleophile aminohydrolase [Cenococcum geophilum 1.58]|uniref:N-terminal nucleophile aminohydrolase n=1 Tax=Cenococcum geophilum 1.58 TaxID=794803 RepID=UPI00358E4011|nr:N-terminal nucleophile aminohydrolase [Cenococcum geophilum 1.58]
MLLRGELGDGGGAQGHCQLSGEYFFTQRRWDEHQRGLKVGQELVSSIAQFHDPFSAWPNNSSVTKPAYRGSEKDPSWDGKEYLPQGTVGAVVLDSFGTVCVATSTGGLTNKLPGRIGDTPTLGAGFWAEEWFEEISPPQMLYQPIIQPPHPSSSIDKLSRGNLPGFIAGCFPSVSIASSSSHPQTSTKPYSEQPVSTRRHAVAMSGTGNGDSFLRVSAVRTAAAISRFSVKEKVGSSVLSL